MLFSKLHPELGTPPLNSHLQEPFQPWEDPTGFGQAPLVDKLVRSWDRAARVAVQERAQKCGSTRSGNSVPPPTPSASQGVSAGGVGWAQQGMGTGSGPAHLLHSRVSCDYSGANSVGPRQQHPVNFLFVAISPC